MMGDVSSETSSRSERAAELQRQASDASERGDIRGAAELFEEAASLLRADADAAHACEAWLQAASSAARCGDAGATLRLEREALADAKATADAGVVARVHLRIGERLLAGGDHEASRRPLTAALERAMAAETPATAARALTRLAEVERLVGDRVAARSAVIEAVEMWRSLGPQRRAVIGEAMTLLTLGAVDRADGDVDTAGQCFERARELAVSASDFHVAAQATSRLAHVALADGDPTTARTLYEQAESWFDREGARGGAIAARANLAHLLVGEGQLDEAAEIFRGAARDLAELGQHRAALDSTMMAAQIDGRRGRLDEVEDELSALARHAETLGYTEAQVRLGVNLAAVEYARGDLPRAVTAYLRSARRFRQLHNLTDEARSLLAAAEALLAGEDYERAAELAGEATRLMDGAGGELGAVEARAMEARIRVEADPDDDALEELGELCVALGSSGCTVEALGHRLAIAEARARRCEDLPNMAALLAAADEMGLAPLCLDIESVTLLQAPSDPAAQERLAQRADAAGWILLARRIRRRA